MIKKDITGQKFGRLTAIKPSRKSNSRATIWLCKCDCGQESEVRIDRLTSGETLSCGCLMRESSSKKHHALHYVDGTNIEILKSKKVKKNNKSGYTGVFWYERNKCWLAYIKFKNHRYNLGSFENKEDAIAARKAAESRLHDEFVEWYESQYGVVKTRK